jgi:molybdopterin-guanine dinucleotide biosynthesis protein A
MTPLAVVLAGGEGQRMGGSKPLRQLGAKTLIARAVELARSYSDEVAVAVRNPEQVGQLDVRLVTDDPVIVGPLAGLAAALRVARADGRQRILTLACDMPRLPRDLGDRLDAAIHRRPEAKVAVASSGGRLHPVCALWKTEALDEVEAYAQGGWRSLKGCATACGCVIVTWDVGEFDPFVNANTPEDLAALQAEFRF